MKSSLITAAMLATLYAPVWAVNKCTGADGRIAFQDAVCDTKSKSVETVKTWGNVVQATSRGSAAPAVTPNLKLVGPPGSEPLLALYRRWADAERLALSISRIALGGPAAGLQALQREVETTKVPVCLEGAQKILTTLVTKTTEAILQFMGKEEVTAMAYQIIDRRKLVPEFENSITTANCR